METLHENLLLCWVSMRRYQLILDGTVGQNRACMPLYIEESGDLVGCYQSLTNSQTEGKIELLKLLRSRGGALVTQ